MFGIDPKAAKAPFAAFEQQTSQLQPPFDPWLRALVALIQALAKAFGE
jgi:hypothetical protein